MFHRGRRGRWHRFTLDARRRVGDLPTARLPRRRIDGDDARLRFAPEERVTHVRGARWRGGG